MQDKIRSLLFKIKRVHDNNSENKISRHISQMIASVWKEYYKDSHDPQDEKVNNVSTTGSLYYYFYLLPLQTLGCPCLKADVSITDISQVLSRRRYKGDGNSSRYAIQ